MQFVMSPLLTPGLWAQGVVSPLSVFSLVLLLHLRLPSMQCGRKVGRGAVLRGCSVLLTGTVVAGGPRGVFLFCGLWKHQLSSDQSQMTTPV